MEESPRENGRRWWPRARRLLLRICGALLLFVVLAEIAARVSGLVDRLVPYQRAVYVGTPAPDVPYRLRPGAALDFDGTPVEVNALGLRDRPGVAPTPAPGTRRVLVVGDSVAFGWRQPADASFPRLLEERLNEGASAARPIEVLNGGVPGYNATTEAAWFRDFGLPLRPETVVVLVNLNDFDRTPHLSAVGILTTDESTSRLAPQNWSELYFAALWMRMRLAGDPRVNSAAPAPKTGRWDPFDTYVSNLRKRFYRNPTEPQWSGLRAAWRDLAARARENGIRLVFAIVPDGDQIDVPEPDLTPQRRLLEVCAEEGLDCVDLTPDFAAMPAGTSLFTDIMHPNAAGHAVAAGAVAKHLAR